MVQTVIEIGLIVAGIVVAWMLSARNTERAMTHGFNMGRMTQDKGAISVILPSVSTDQPVTAEYDPYADAMTDNDLIPTVPGDK